jgi:acyl phosphate:glycerol-3-phosphate acyltransferase
MPELPLIELAVWTAIAFLAGSLPFSVWIGRGLLNRDITRFGDANPGATNVMRAGGKKLGALALLLDTLKALLPVSAAYYWAGIQDWRIIPIALAPIAGHAFSPFLGWHGGKAVATSLGTWMALTIWEGPAFGGLLLWFFTWLVGANGWAVLFMFLCLLPILLVLPPSWHLLGAPPSPAVIVGVWLGNVAIVLYKHRTDLAHPPQRRPRSRKSTAL